MKHETSLKASTELDAQERSSRLDETTDIERSESLVRLLDQYLEDVQAGRVVDPQQLVADNPELAEPLQACLAGIEFIQQAGGSNLQQIAGFRVLREIGRGGMGAVYEAEELALGRRVALKVLRFGPVSDGEALDRFRREAETVAGLHHTNIVPIYSVGSEGGVNFFAMQFVDGPSLAEVAEQADGPLQPRKVASWGLQAAEALEHAHCRGVIHRDVKPSNLLLDKEQRIWLTDFGLARRLDDVTLSLTGALLGTPRYMSPEQASATRNRVDQRTDVYSLGATLYELATGRPLFPGQTPHALIAEILTQEPSSARSVCPEIPRDLDTILSKCLAKEPSGRYLSAGELANDLRAFLDGRPIRARRIGPLDRTLRWARRNHRSILLAFGSVAATLILVLATIFGRQTYDFVNRAYLTLDSDRPALAAQLLDNSGQPVSEKQTLPTYKPLEAPAGTYRIRLQGPGRLEQDTRITLPAGDRSEYSLDLEDQLLWKRKVQRAYVTVRGSRPGRLLELNDDGVTLLAGETGRKRWSLRLVENKVSPWPDAPGLIWPWDRGPQSLGRGDDDLRPQAFVAGDLDGDGEDDLILAGRHQAWLLALSGKSGRRLWLAARGSDVQQPAEPPASRFTRQTITSTVLPSPIRLDDLNGDGTDDLLITWVDSSSANGGIPPKRRIEAVSGQDGSAIWMFEPDASWFATETSDSIPYAFRWFSGYNRHLMVRQGGQAMFGDVYCRITLQFPRVQATDIYVPSVAEIVTTGRGAEVWFVAGDRFCRLDRVTGRLVETQQLPFRPGSRPNWRDADGDGEPELIGLAEAPPENRSEPTLARLFVWSPHRQKLLWQRSLQVALPRRPVHHASEPNWPQVADLDDDGKLELLFPSGGFTDQFPGYRQVPWCEFAVCDLGTGAIRWRRKLPNADRQLDRFVIGSDVDGDGVRDVFATTVWGNEHSIHVDALSGVDGQTIWTNHAEPPKDVAGNYFPGNPRMAQSEPNGSPRLFVPLVNDHENEGVWSGVCFSTTTGEFCGSLSDLAETRWIDLDGDGVEELLGYQPHGRRAFDWGGELTVIRGVAREPWRWLGVPWSTADDMDGDGVRDLVKCWKDGTVHAMSGSSGRLLWTVKISGLEGMNPEVVSGSELRPENSSAAASEADLREGVVRNSGDLDGDGRPDLLVVARFSGMKTTSPIHALSGANGRRLWSANMQVSGVRAVPLAAICDLDNDKSPELIVVLAAAWDVDVRSHPGTQRLWAASLDGRTGRLQWRKMIAGGSDAKPGQEMEPAYESAALQLRTVDCNGDGVRDVLLPAYSENVEGLNLQALSGTNGDVLWRRALPSNVDRFALRNVPPALVADLDGDGGLEIYQLAFADQIDKDGARSRTAQLTALDPTSGESQWTWQRPVAENCGRIDSGHRKLLDRPMPRRLRRSDGPDWLALGLWGMPGQLLVLNQRGTIVDECDVLAPWDTFRVWVHDVDQDGQDEIVWSTDGKFQACNADALNVPIWDYKFPQGQHPNVIDVPTQEPGDAPTLAVHVTTPRNVVYGFEGRTGSLLWTCGGPLPRNENMWLEMSSVDLLGSEKRDETPLVLFTFGHSSVCRQASLAPDAISTTAETGVNPRVTEVSRRVFRDDRLIYPLPWTPPETTVWRQVWLLIGTLAFYCAVFLLIPFGYVYHLVRQPRWRLTTLAAAPVVVGLMLVGLTWTPDVVNQASTPVKLLLSLAALPVAVALALVVRWSLRVQWGWLLTAFTLTCLSSAALAVAALQLDRRDMDPALQYESSNWFWILFPGAYVTCCLLTIGLVASFAWKAVRGFWWRRRSPESPPPPPVKKLDERAAVHSPGAGTSARDDARMGDDVG